MMLNWVYILYFSSSFMFVYGVYGALIYNFPFLLSFPFPVLSLGIGVSMVGRYLFLLFIS